MVASLWLAPWPADSGLTANTPAASRHTRRAMWRSNRVEQPQAAIVARHVRAAQGDEVGLPVTQPPAHQAGGEARPAMAQVERLLGRQLAARLAAPTIQRTSSSGCHRLISRLPTGKEVQRHPGLPDDFQLFLPVPLEITSMRRPAAAPGRASPGSRPRRCRHRSGASRSTAPGVAAAGPAARQKSGTGSSSARHMSTPMAAPTHHLRCRDRSTAVFTMTAA